MKSSLLSIEFESSCFLPTDTTFQHYVIILFIYSRYKEGVCHTIHWFPRSKLNKRSLCILFTVFLCFFFFLLFLSSMNTNYLGTHLTRHRFKYCFNQGFCIKSKVQRICSTGDWWLNFVPKKLIKIKQIAGQNFIVPKKLSVTMTIWIGLTNTCLTMVRIRY